MKKLILSLLCCTIVISGVLFSCLYREDSFINCMMNGVLIGGAILYVHNALKRVVSEHVLSKIGAAYFIVGVLLMILEFYFMIDHLIGFSITILGVTLIIFGILGSKFIKQIVLGFIKYS